MYMYLFNTLLWLYLEWFLNSEWYPRVAILSPGMVVTLYVGYRTPAHFEHQRLFRMKLEMKLCCVFHTAQNHLWSCQDFFSGRTIGKQPHPIPHHQQDAWFCDNSCILANLPLSPQILDVFLVTIEIHVCCWVQNAKPRTDIKLTFHHLMWCTKARLHKNIIVCS